MKLSSLRAKVMLLLLLSMLPVIALEFNTARQERLRSEQHVAAEALRLARLFTSKQQALFESSRQLLMTLSQVGGIRTPKDSPCEELLKNLLKLNPIYANAGACDASGNITCSALDIPGPKNLSDRVFFRTVKETRDFAVGQYDAGRVTSKKSMLLAYPILDEDKPANEQFAGVVFLAIDLEAASNSGMHVTLPPGGMMMVFRSDDVCLLRYPDPNAWIGASIKDGPLLRTLPPEHNEGTMKIDGEDGKERLYAVNRFKITEGHFLYVAVGIESAPAYAPFQRQLLRQLGIVTGIALAALLGAWVIGSLFIVRPARHLVEVARSVSGGDLQVRSKLSPKTGEFGEIGAAFNQMADTLSRRIGELNEVQLALRQAHDQLESRVERRTAELRIAQERLVDAIENIDAGFVMFGPDGRLVISNQTYREMFGLGPSEVKPGVTFEQILHTFASKGGKVAGYPHTEDWIADRLAIFNAADGRNTEQNMNSRWMRSSDHRMRDGGIVSLRTDVTSLKAIQESLLLRDRAIASLNSAVIVTDPTVPDNPIVDTNPAFEQITGYSKAEATGRNCRFLQGPESDPKSIDIMRQAIARGLGAQVVIRNYRKDKSAFWNETKIAPVLDSSGRITHFVGAMTDVTERVESQKALEHAAEELRRSNQELEQFAYIASHDLQEPLRMVASYTQLLARRYKDKLDKDALEFIDYAVDGAKRMQAFIQDLLQYSRVGTHGRPFQQVALEPLVRHVLENLRLAIDEKNAEIVVGPLPQIEGDPVQLAQLFQNLLSNALKFKGEKPLRVEIEAIRTDRMWEIIVRDNGIDIDPADFERIFVIFQRLHSRQEFEGTGIGLAVCKKIVERHRGRIWVESRKGEGAAFHFTLPDKESNS